MIKFICLIKPLKICLITVLGQLPPRKIAPNPKTNSNPNPNPDPGRGGGGGQFSSGAIVQIPLITFLTKQLFAMT